MIDNNQNPRRNKLVDHPLITLTSVAASLIAIIAFISGKQNLPSFFVTPTPTSGNTPTSVQIVSISMPLPQNTLEPTPVLKIVATPTIEEADLTGSWSGTLLQPLPNGSIDTWMFLLILTHSKDGSVSGEAEMSVPPLPYYARSKVEGFYSDSKLSFEDTEWIQTYPAQLKYCHKKVELIYNKHNHTLSGSWYDTQNSACTGRLTLVR